MNLIQEYIELTKVCASTDYSDDNSVNLHNKSVDRMYEIAETIGYVKTTETIRDFLKLLDITENRTNAWAAIHILERIPADKDSTEKSINIIKNIASSDSFDSVGFKIWLKEFETKKGKATNR